MASFWSIFAMLVVFVTYYSSLALASDLHRKVSTISAAPALLPGASAPVASPSLSPDITPLFPSPGGVALPPSESSLPIIPSSRSPPNPDVTVAPTHDTAFPPSGSLPESASVSIAQSGPRNLVLLLSLVVVGIMLLPGM
ncbi:Classical arabinogalactan protein 26 [Morella rubra]|uniref:Classical arabinogalactan protein 26 n=1 Tax=Morella rubra TaxID=262757 RepID=A0A6A1UH10_9ROSI|nr:Classical arabinogalactan protein 26 [Morella rubra]